ncbi:hypothetical protein GGQ68_000796 [Sagittula marina]|uniref:Uncharacterized protein n=1 Tax=Sagittula marina TaxID=943940 RepID=A0A7W6DPR8_9RHOB|nr:hypothetical protein [Sagittula marina]MBB3984480.1 hypothetical protein [Sagittula marina]
MIDPLPTRAALATLLAIHLLMLFALYTETAPHPPPTIPLFALGPFLTAVIAIGCATWMMAGRPGATWLSVVTAILAMVSLGPQKYVDPAFAEIWPAVITGQVAIFVLLAQALDAFRTRTKAQADVTT